MSTTVIDAFMTTLGLDGSHFKRGMKEAGDAQDKLDRNTKRTNRDREKAEQDAAKARERRQKQTDEQGKRTVDGYKKIRNELLAMGAVFTAGMGIKDFLVNTINSAANLGYLSQNLRMSTEDLTSWQRASERAGGSAEGIIAQLKESQDTLAQLKSGMGPNEGLQAFFRWGGNKDDIKDGNTYLLARARIIAEKFKEDPAQAGLIARQMGISEDQFNFLKQGPDAVMALVQAQEKNAAVTAKDAAEALKLKNRLLDLRDSLAATGTRIAVQLIPLIDLFVERLTKLSQWAVDHKDDIARWVDNTIKWIKDFAKTADGAAEAVGGWKNVLYALAAFKAVSIAADLVGLAGSLFQVGRALGVIGGAGGAVGVLGSLAGVGLAGAAGYGVGTLINDHLLPDSWKDKIGEGVTHMLAAVGVSEAKEALENNRKASEAKRSASGKITGGSVADPKDVVDKLKAMGWTPEQAAGIAASFKQESALSPTARNPKSGAYGIGQWLGPRVADFKAFAGRDLVGSSLDDQLRFFQHEVTQGKERAAGDKLRRAQTAEDAARIHSEAYERPGQDEANVARRQKLAGQLAASDRARNAAVVGSIPTGAGASLAATTSTSTSTSKSEVNIDTITINTQATDAKGIASSIRPAVEKYSFSTQANTGLR